MSGDANPAREVIWRADGMRDAALALLRSLAGFQEPGDLDEETLRDRLARCVELYDRAMAVALDAADLEAARAARWGTNPVVETLETTRELDALAARRRKRRKL